MGKTYTIHLLAKFGVFGVKIGSPYVQLPLCFEEVKIMLKKRTGFILLRRKEIKRREDRRKGGGGG